MPKEANEQATAPPPGRTGPHWIIQLSFAVLAGLCIYAFVDMAKHAEARRSCEPIVQLRPRYMGHDRVAPDFDLSDGKGGRVKLSSYRGKAVILHFWTKTCQPCLEELPELAQFAEIVKSRNDVVILTVTIDDGPAAIKDVLATVFGEKPPPFLIAFDPPSDVVRGRYGTKLFPETWLIDARGIIRARFDGVPMAGDRCEVAWKNPLLLSALDSLESPQVCDITIDPKLTPQPDKLIAPCRH